jgi:hypothetical protein
MVRHNQTEYPLQQHVHMFNRGEGHVLKIWSWYQIEFYTLISGSQEKLKSYIDLITRAPKTLVWNA